MSIAKQIRLFLEITEMPKTIFCKRVGFSPTTLDKILNGIDVSNRTIESAQTFMSQRTKMLVDASR